MAPRAPEGVARRQAGRDPLGADEIGIHHAEGLEDPLAEVPLEGDPAHVLDDLAQRGVTVVGVGERRAGLGHYPETPAVVLGERRQRLSSVHAEDRRTAFERPSFGMEQVRDSLHLRDPGGVGQQMAHGRWPEAGLRRDQLVSAQVVVSGTRRGRSSPCSHSCITAIAVKVLVIEPIRKTVSSVTGAFEAISARPCP